LPEQEKEVQVKHLRQIAGRELSAFFSSLAAFIFLAAFLASVYFIFFWADPFFARNIADLRPVFEWMPTLMIFLVSALTMRMWSEERRSGTIESLLTSPVSNFELVTGKFLACLILVLIALCLTVPLPFCVCLMGPLDWGPVAGGYVATIFLAAAYAAIGLTISSRTDNQIVSLILSVAICAVFVIIGSDAFTSLFASQAAEVMKLLGTSSRFQSIIRGVVDFRDLYYYLSLTGIFLSLNVLFLEKLRWAGNRMNARHSDWTVLTCLVIANLVAGNFWLAQVSCARLDLTEGQIYSISQVSRNYLAGLKEPLLIRAYFSKRTHPLLAPLVPRMRDLLREYALAGNGKVRLEFVDPLENPAVEREAIEKYAIEPVTFRTASKYQAALTASYFNVLVKYGDQFETMGYRDLSSIKMQAEDKIAIDLKNPEYEITRAIKKVMQAYQSAGSPFAGIDQKIHFVGYISADDRLPKFLVEAKKACADVLESLKKKSSGKFTYEFVDPDAGGGAESMKLLSEFGFRPYSRGSEAGMFWFNMTLRDGQKLVALQLPSDPSRESLEREFKIALRRFSRAFMKTVGIYSPASRMQAYSLSRETRRSFSLLEKKLAGSHSLCPLNLDEGAVPSQVDLMLVLSPHKMKEKELFALDQFLMRGGTVMICTSAFDVDIAQRPVKCRKEESGLADWLKHYGIELQNNMVLDKQAFPFPLPVTRMVAGYKVEGTELVPYPFFVDVRKDGMNPDGDITGSINQMTLTWASPLAIDSASNKQRHVRRLLQSSPASWTSASGSIAPVFSGVQMPAFPEGADKGRKLLGVAVEGCFESYFKGKKSPRLQDVRNSNADSASASKAGADSDKSGQAGQEVKDRQSRLSEVIEKSPASARIILFSSSGFASDEVLFLIGAGLGTPYENPIELIDNAVDWSLEDRGLLSVRGRGTFARTLKTLTPFGAVVFEYGSYLLAAAGLGVVWLLRCRIRRRTENKFKRLLEAVSGPSAPQEVHSE
jgi:ABC-2 type transport system permease protein